MLQGQITNAKKKRGTAATKALVPEVRNETGPCAREVSNNITGLLSMFSVHHRKTIDM